MYAPARGLNGACDFALSYARLQEFMKAPVFCIIEAEKQDVEQGILRSSLGPPS